MNHRLMIPLLAIALACAVPASAADSGHIDAYVTPYYDSRGPVIDVGTYSAGLASSNVPHFVATAQEMKRHWDRLTFAQVYVGAARLFDSGFRNEATYWFYSAQYRGRLFGMLLDQKKMGSLGSPGFELFHAQDAFFQLFGPDINGFAFADPALLLKIIRRVQSENKSVPPMQQLYPRVAFLAKSEWPQKNAELNAGLEKLAASIQSGTPARSSHLHSKPFPGGF